MSRLEGTDPSGAGVQEQKVNARGEALVKAIVETAFERHSEDGLAYNWSSGTIDIDAGDTVQLLKNESDKPLHIESISIDNGSVASEYIVHLPTAEITPTGATVTGTLLNTGKAGAAEALAKSDETQNTQGAVIFTRFLAVDSGTVINTRGLILGKNKSVAVDVVGDTSESAVTIRGHYET